MNDIVPDTYHKTGYSKALDSRMESEVRIAGKPLDDDFKFTFYVSYFDRQSAVGLRMLEHLQELNSKHFELKLHVSKANKPGL